MVLGSDVFEGLWSAVNVIFISDCAWEETVGRTISQPMAACGCLPLGAGLWRTMRRLPQRLLLEL